MTPPPPRTSGPFSAPSVRLPAAVTVDAVRLRVLAKMAEKLDPAKLRRMPASFMHKEVRKTVEQLVESEGSRLGKIERDLLIEDVLRDAIGFGPLEELFSDAGVKEILVLNHQTVLARRDEQSWLPTNVKFRDPEHLRQVVEKMAAQADTGVERLSKAAVDGRLVNGFRILAVTPPSILNFPTYVVFVRGDVPATNGTQTSGTVAASTVTRTPSPTHSPSPRPSTVNATPAPRPSAIDPAADMLARLRVRIAEHIISRLASLGVSDTSRLDIRELQRAVTAYVQEFCEIEKVRLSDAHTTRLIHDILTSIRPSI